jgi:hypothetical protein
MADLLITHFEFVKNDEKGYSSERPQYDQVSHPNNGFS